MNAKWKFARKHGGHRSYLRPAALSSSESSAPLCSLPIITKSYCGMCLINEHRLSFYIPAWSFKTFHHSYSQQRERGRLRKNDTCKREWFPHGNVCMLGSRGNCWCSRLVCWCIKWQQQTWCEFFRMKGYKWVPQHSRRSERERWEGTNCMQTHKHSSHAHTLQLLDKACKLRPSIGRLEPKKTILKM